MQSTIYPCILIVIYDTILSLKVVLNIISD